jgi:hypothetical protein
MSTALSHHNRIPTATAGAAVLAIVAAGVVLGVVHDSNDGARDTIAPPPPPLTLTGGSNQHGSWDHAGTLSGGKTQPGL